MYDVLAEKTEDREKVKRLIVSMLMKNKYTVGMIVKELRLIYPTCKTLWKPNTGTRIRAMLVTMSQTIPIYQDPDVSRFYGHVDAWYYEEE